MMTEYLEDFTEEPEEEITPVTPAPLVTVGTEEFLSETKKILAEVIETKNFDSGFDYINELYAQAETDAKAISIMLAGMEENWDKSLYEGQSFLQVATKRTPFSAETIRRHTTNQWLLESDKIPEEFRPQIEAGKQNSLERIANVVKEGFELERKDWLSLSEKVDDERAVGKIVREIRGVPPRSNWLMIWIDEKGVLWAQTKDELVQGGRLDIFSDSPAVQKLVLRMTNCAGVKPRVEV